MSAGGGRLPALAACVAVLIATVCLGLGGAQHGGKSSQEIRSAPESARVRENPYAGSHESIQAGRKLFRRHCAECHGEDARGREKAPDLHSHEVQNAAPGSLVWFLRNGNLREGMPSWSRLPEERLWQIVSYLQSLEHAAPAAQPR